LIYDKATQRGAWRIGGLQRPSASCGRFCVFRIRTLTEIMSNHQQLLQRLRNHIILESQTQRSELLAQWGQPLSKRLSRGTAIAGLDVEKIDRNGTIFLSCQINNSRFREGDYLILHQGNPEGVEAISCVLDYDDETQLEVSMHSGNSYFLEQNRNGWIADEGVLDLSPFYLDALDQAADTIKGREKILPIISGDLKPSIDYVSYEYGWEEAASAGLNDSQAEAVAQAYATDLVHLIQGPPGTGKTFVLAHLVRLFVADGRRVLVTALTHRAINNALEKIQQLDNALPVCKIGSATRGRGLMVDNFENFVESGFGDISGGYAIGATPFATQSERLSHVEFDVVIFDEASQVTLPLAIMGMLAGEKYIFIGDERQLPPVSKLTSSELARTSIFGYLSGRGYETMLTVTYRMNDVITAWPSRTFYEGKIQPGPGIGERRLKLPVHPERWKDVLDPELPIVFLDLGHHNTTSRSYREAQLVCDLLEVLIGCGIPPADIGVVAPYRAQGRAIRNLLRRILPDRNMLKELVVDTVERMQGQEREIVLISLTTSNPTYAEQIAEFFFQPERLNVAVTRPRTKLIIVGSSNVLNAAPVDPDYEAWVEILGDLLAHCTCYRLEAGSLTL
jgi:DNA replication ATP-dependent helicase Dna2